MPYKDPEKQRAFQRGWAAKRRAEWFAGKTCAACGGTDRLELHHLDPTEKESHAIWSWSAKRRETELAKCVPMCKSCHKGETRQQRHDQAVARNDHGTRGRYDLGCRCVLCSRAKVTYNQAHPPRALPPQYQTSVEAAA